MFGTKKIGMVVVLALLAGGAMGEGAFAVPSRARVRKPHSNHKYVLRHSLSRTLTKGHLVAFLRGQEVAPVGGLSKVTVRKLTPVEKRDALRKMTSSKGRALMPRYGGEPNFPLSQTALGSHVEKLAAYRALIKDARVVEGKFLGRSNAMGGLDVLMPKVQQDGKFVVYKPEGKDAKLIVLSSDVKDVERSGRGNPWSGMGGLE